MDSCAILYYSPHELILVARTALASKQSLTNLVHERMSKKQPSAPPLDAGVPTFSRLLQYCMSQPYRTVSSSPGSCCNPGPLKLWLGMHAVGAVDWPCRLILPKSLAQVCAQDDLQGTSSPVPTSAESVGRAGPKVCRCRLAAWARSLFATTGLVRITYQGLWHLLKSRMYQKRNRPQLAHLASKVSETTASVHR
jgi:hypothetical protein